MTEEDNTEDGLALILRVEEWAAYFPVHKDNLEPNLLAVSGETGIELKKGERLSDLEVLPTQQMKHLPVPATDHSEAKNIQVKLVVFRATFARMVEGKLPEDPNQEKVSRLITPPERPKKRRKS